MFAALRSRSCQSEVAEKQQMDDKSCEQLPVLCSRQVMLQAKEEV